MRKRRKQKRHRPRKQKPNYAMRPTVLLSDVLKKLYPVEYLKNVMYPPLAGLIQKMTYWY